MAGRSPSLGTPQRHPPSVRGDVKMTGHQANVTRPVVIVNRPVVIFPCNVSQMKRDARRRMVVTTAKLLQRQGYNGTGLNQIVAEAEAPKGSLYFHFPGGKEQLAAEAIAASAAYLDAGLRACERATRAGVARPVRRGGRQAAGAHELRRGVPDRHGHPRGGHELGPDRQGVRRRRRPADLAASRAGSSATGSAPTRLAGVPSSSTRASRVRCCWPRRGRAWSR